MELHTLIPVILAGALSAVPAIAGPGDTGGPERETVSAEDRERFLVLMDSPEIRRIFEDALAQCGAGADPGGQTDRDTPADCPMAWRFREALEAENIPRGLVREAMTPFLPYRPATGERVLRGREEKR